MAAVESDLPFPVYFVISNRGVQERWANVLADSSNVPNPDEIHHLLTDSSPHSLVVQTYLYLKREGLNVHLVADFVPGEINYAPYADLGRRSATPNKFILCCRSDRARPHLADITIVQNQTNVKDSAREFYIHHWPQPGLIPRDKIRGTRIENVVYKGAPHNLDERLRTKAFEERLAALGCRLNLGSKFVSGEYNDYREADVVLAIRNLTHYYANNKPVSKLATAWLAGCPAILGPESAYRAMRESDLDYIEARNEDDVISALTMLLEKPELYMSMLETGRRRAKEVDPEQIKMAWFRFFSGPVADGFRKWKKANKFVVSFWRPSQYAIRLVRHKLNQRLHPYRASYGRRICD